MSNRVYNLLLQSQSGQSVDIRASVTQSVSYQINYPLIAPSNNEVLLWDGVNGRFNWYDISGLSSGTVTSVGLSAPSQFSVTNSPVTTTGDLTFSWLNQPQNLIFASPSSGTGQPSFRNLILADLPIEVSSRYQVIITNADLITGVYTLNHQLGKYPIISVISNDNQVIGISPTHTTTSAATIDFSAVGALTGNWTIIAIA
jgi:hypothetical protein